MQKGGRAPKSRLSAELYVFIVLILVSFFILLLSTRTLMESFRDTSVSLFSGARSRVYDLSSLVSRSILSMRELARLREENSQLRELVTRYERFERSAAEISQENKRLREQLSFSQGLDYRHIPAEIAGRDPDNLYSALVINKGRRSGIQKDMAVVAWQGGSQALVGKVIQVSSFESLIMPLYDTSLLVASRFAASRYEGIVEGQGSPDSPLRMRFIPKRARDEISRGDLIVSSGMGGVYPPGINIGRIAGITYYEHEISMEAEVEPVIDFSRLEYVFVIEKNSRLDNGEDFPPADASSGEGYLPAEDRLPEGGGND